ncbi:hypothetical protein DEO72_LG11g1443 [Vigna unguiculata]|uniref:Uncharacterized protein n=1 Tax=Vigna unguiculata TaxID=3917 RepID=A0A4D6NKW9_VIGUN|nr:hypothetical protein DEO72_LG11g1443 [Vigna unguiculata]
MRTRLGETLLAQARAPFAKTPKFSRLGGESYNHKQSIMLSLLGEYLSLERGVLSPNSWATRLSEPLEHNLHTSRSLA